MGGHKEMVKEGEFSGSILYSFVKMNNENCLNCSMNGSMDDKGE
jgi:hypothetical protein